MLHISTHYEILPLSAVAFPSVSSWCLRVYWEPQAAVLALHLQNFVNLPRAARVLSRLEHAMQTTRLAIDPLWQCLCPSWTGVNLSRAPRRLAQRTRLPGQVQSLRSITQHAPSRQRMAAYKPRADDLVPTRLAGLNAFPTNTPPPRKDRQRDSTAQDELLDTADLEQETTPYLYTRLRALALGGKTKQCRQIVEYLVRERGERPNVQLYNALITSNVHYMDGAAWRVSELLDEMVAQGLAIDVGTCHAVLKALSVHPDHLLRSDMLEHMQARWFQVSEDGAHDVAAGLLRDGLYEKALDRLDGMRRESMRIQPWLLDMAVYALCDAKEPEEAYRIMRARHDAGELKISRNVWYTLLDTASTLRHHAATAFVWTHFVGVGYFHPSTGISLNVLTTAAHAGDAVLATDVFTHLAKCGAPLQPIHYQMLIECYLSMSPPDVERAVSILTIMPLEKLEPSSTETRSLYLHLHNKPDLVVRTQAHLRELHGQGRKIPIAVLNLLIECYVEQRNLSEAFKLYKLIHTFVPLKEGIKKTFANIETFNLLLRGCRTANPPNEELASFLVSELLALRIKPTALTYDRLILVYVAAAKHALQSARKPPVADEKPAIDHKAKGVELLDWAFRHFVDMQAITQQRAGQEGKAGWMPRFGTIETLARVLAQTRDRRCWDVLQAAEDRREVVEAWDEKGKWMRRNVEEAWEKAVVAKEDDITEHAGLEGGDRQAVAAAAA